MTTAIPGAIAEAYFTIEDGVVVLRDRDDKHITSRALLKDQDPAAVARALLREAEEPKDFNRPISTRSWGSRDQPFSAASINSMLLK